MLGEGEVVRDAWISAAVTRFPELDGKIFTYDVPGVVGTVTFRDPATAEGIESLVTSDLSID